MKRFLVVLAILSYARISEAGIYLGPQVGMSINRGQYIQISNNYSLTSPAGNGHAFLGGAVLGYDYTNASGFYTGVNTAVTFHSLNNKSYIEGVPNHAMSTRLKNKFLISMSLLFGTTLSNQVVPFVSLGVTQGRYTFEINNQQSFNYSGLFQGAKQRLKKNIVAFTPGFGVKFPISEDKIKATISYNYFKGPKLAKTFSTGTQAFATFEHVQKIQQHSVNFALVYHL